MIKIRFKSKVASAYEILKNNILSGQYKYGEVLSANTLVDELEMSRTPILEAFKILESEDLVKVVPQVGVVVKQLDEEEINNRNAVLAILEGYMAGEVAAKNDHEVLRELQDIIDQMRDCVETKNTGEFAKLNYRFHQTIWEAGNNEYAYSLITRLKVYHEKYLQFQKVLFGPDKMEASYQDHLACYEAIRSNDVELARKLMESHVLKSRKKVQELILHSAEEVTDSPSF